MLPPCRGFGDALPVYSVVYVRGDGLIRCKDIRVPASQVRPFSAQSVRISAQLGKGLKTSNAKRAPCSDRFKWCIDRSNVPCQRQRSPKQKGTERSSCIAVPRGLLASTLLITEAQPHGRAILSASKTGLSRLLMKVTRRSIGSATLLWCSTPGWAWLKISTPNLNQVPFGGHEPGMLLSRWSLTAGGRCQAGAHSRDPAVPIGQPTGRDPHMAGGGMETSFPGHRPNVCNMTAFLAFL
jgi:hypothetical protein